MLHPGDAIECPKCRTRGADGAAECSRCGIVFAKVAARSRAVPYDVRPSTVSPQGVATAVGDPLHAVRLVGRAALLAALAWWTVSFARAPVGTAAIESVLHLPNLVFHEAGHVILGIFGRFVGVLGGSLLQLAVPLVLAGAFARQRDWFAAAVCTWWAGQNLVDLAPYIADARALQLVLLGGKTGAEVEGHDWEFLLTQFGWLHLDRALGVAAHRFGLIVMCGALVWGAVSLRRRVSPSHPPT